MRLKRLTPTVLTIALVALSACAPPQARQPQATPGAPPGTSQPAQTGQASPPAQAAETIKFALLAPTTGTPAASGQDMIRGWNLFWEEHGLNVCGGKRRIELFHEDTAGNPDTALSKARLLVEQRKVDALFGPLLANEAYAVAEYVKDKGVPLFAQVGSSDDLTQRTRFKNVLRPAGWSSSLPHHPFGEWLYDKEGVREILTIGSDYAFGHEVVGGFVNTFTDKGGKVLNQLWNPLGTPDFSSYMAQIKSANPPAVFSIQVGADSTRFMKAWAEFGLKDKVKLYGGEVLLDQSLLRSMGDEALGVISVGHFAEGRDAPGTRDFVRKFDEKYKLLPSYYAAASYAVAQWMVPALEAVGCDVQNRDAFLEAVKKVKLDDSPLGPMVMDEYGQPIMNVYIRKVERRPDGRLWNVVTETIPNVSQFWKYDPQEFLKQPVYSRTYQGTDWPKKP